MTNHLLAKQVAKLRHDRIELVVANDADRCTFCVKAGEPVLLVGGEPAAIPGKLGRRQGRVAGIEVRLVTVIQSACTMGSTRTTSSLGPERHDSRRTNAASAA